jgi:peptidoglycan/xylan/chitin deacetylase (PgdA/CDA1 family)
LWQEVRESKAVLEEWTGTEVTYLAYPYGDFDWRALELLPRAGYQGAVTTIDGLSHDENRFTLRRIAVGGQTTFPQFVAAVNGLRDAVGQMIRTQDRRLLS